MRWLALVALAAGCGSRQDMAAPARPGEAEAVAIVWYQEFKATSVPPVIEWRANECGKGSREGFLWDGKCYAGLYLRDDRILLAWEGSMHASALAHELMHALQWQAGVEDPDHKRDKEWKVVKSAEGALEKEGL